MLLALLLLPGCLAVSEEARLAGELAACRDQLTDQSYLSQACSTVSKLVSKDSQFKAGIERLLRHLDLLQQDATPGEVLERELVLSIGPKDLRRLRQFVLVDQGSAAEVEDILVRSLRPRESWLDWPDVLPGLPTSAVHFQANFVICFQVLVLLCCIALPLLLGARKWVISILVILCAVLQNWVRLYYMASAKKQAVLSKHTANAGCLLEKKGWLAATTEFIGGLFNGVEDPCEAYYTAAMVDPAFEVGPLDAVVETFTVCLVVPGRACGAALGSFYSHLLLPLPLAWKIPILGLSTVVLLFLLLLLCGYEFKIPFLLSIRPAGGQRRSSDGGARGQQALASGQSLLPVGSLPYPSGRSRLDELVEGGGDPRPGGFRE